MTSTLDHVLAHAERLPFVRLVAVLEHMLGCEVGSAAADVQLALTHDAALAFHAAEIGAQRADESADEAPRVRLVSAFAGLTGAVSPLPTALLDATARDEGTPPFAQLLIDVFHHRLLGLFYRGMRAHEPPAHRAHARARTFVLALAGLEPTSAERVTGLPEARLLALAPLLIAHPPNAARLVAGVMHVLDDLADEAQVRVHQGCGARVPLAPSARAALGIDLRLGRTSTLGHTVVCGDAAIHVEIAGLSPEACIALAPGGARWATLRATIRLLTPDHLDAVLVFRPARAPRPQLGRDHRLGRTWLGGAERPHAARFRVGFSSDP